MVSEKKSLGQSLDIVITMCVKWHKDHIDSLKEIEGFKEVYNVEQQDDLNVALKLKIKVPPHVDPQEMFSKVRDHLKGKGYAPDYGFKYNQFVFAGEDYKKRRMSIR